ncbi:ornithine decarboxylase-like isoform X2 [Haliotis asinina]|uniref:ornithine decarboxylase-like isoform X2 n=1 Tax=Haliotis asinina TaxID=109174 RepID=UPI003531C55A
MSFPANVFVVSTEIRTMNKQHVHMVPAKQTTAEKVAAAVNARELKGVDDAFYVMDVGDVVSNHQRWQRLLPRVEPFYAVKCNSDPLLLRVLYELGTGFDCASKCEMDMVLQMGVTADKIVYANPCRQISHLQHAAKKSIGLLTFDSEAELYKVKSVYPGARLLLRIAPPENYDVMYDLSEKFGCHPGDVSGLLRTARTLGLNVVGVSFHVGSGARDPEVFAASLQRSHNVFAIAEKLGFNPDIIDIGGGFYGHKGAPLSFEKAASTLNMALDKYFPVTSNVKVIAEPGRYFASSAFTLVTSVIGKRKRLAKHRDRKNSLSEINVESETSGDNKPAFMYYMTDGVFGSFNVIIFEGTCIIPKLVKAPSSDVTFTSTLWGPTCDSLDCVRKELPLPELHIGDWLYVENMGAYTTSTASRFNGMPIPRCHYISEEKAWNSIFTENGVHISGTTS